jgi:hypothetical protein
MYKQLAATAAAVLQLLPRCSAAAGTARQAGCIFCQGVTEVGCSAAFCVWFRTPAATRCTSARNSCGGHMPAAVLHNTQPAVAAPSKPRTLITVVLLDSLIVFFSWCAWHLIAGARLELLRCGAVRLHRPPKLRREFIVWMVEVNVRGQNGGTPAKLAVGMLLLRVLVHLSLRCKRLA